MKARYLLVSLLATTALSVSAANATVLLTFGQTSTATRSLRHGPS